MKFVRTGSTAPKSPNQALELFIANVDDDLRTSRDRPTPGDNLPRVERMALNKLLNWDDIEIRPYDKGRGFILDTKDHYKTRVLQELNNPTSYSVLAETPSEATSRIGILISSWAGFWMDQGEISEKIFNWVVNPDAKPGAIFQNYKAHKPPHYPPRTICSGCGGPNERLAQILEVELNQHLHFLTHRIQDTGAMLRKLAELQSSPSFPPDAQVLHVTWDIEAMYPNIDTGRGIDACRIYLEER